MQSSVDIVKSVDMPSGSLYIGSESAESLFIGEISDFVLFTRGL